MESFFIWTVGCQMNKADSERLAARLAASGLAQAASVEAADIVVVNSCSVRQTAEDRVVGKLGYLKGLRKRKPKLTIALTGCMVPRDDAELRRRLPFVDFFLPPLQWDPLLRALGDGNGERMAGDAGLEAALCAVEGKVTPVRQPGEDGPTRFVPIIYGCNNFCSYCIVPYRRGREQSRPFYEIVEEVEALAADGAREITLLGQNVDSYGHDLPEKPDLADLLRRIDTIPGLW